MLAIHLLIVLSALVVGIRIGGVGIGAVSALGVLILVGYFHLPISSPPVDVIFIVLAIIAASSTLQATGGVELLVQIASRALWRFPSAVTFVAPLVTYVFTFLAGTGYVAYALLPVIAEVAASAGVRPERPLSISVIASQLAITASPVSAASVAFIGLLSLNHSSFDLIGMMKVCIPSTLIGTALGAISVFWRGKEIEKPVLSGGRVANIANIAKDDNGDHRDGERARIAVAIFLCSVLAIVIVGINPALRPVLPYGDGMRRLDMPQAIQILMLSAVALMIVCCRCKADAITKTPIMHAGIGAILSIYGVAWLGNCFFEGNKPQIVGALADAVGAYPWLFAVALFALSAVVYSQAATVAALMYLGFALNLPHSLLVAMFPAVNGFFFFPTSGTVVAAVAFDPTQSTRIGKYVLNHSFMLPGLVATGGSVVAGIVLTRLFY